MRTSVASFTKKIISMFFAAVLAIGLLPVQALAATDGLSPVPEGNEDAASIASSAEGGDADVFSHCPSDDASSADGAGAATPSEDGSDADDGRTTTTTSANIINQTMPLEVVAQQESMRSYFLAQTLESTKTVPIVSANLPLDKGTDKGPQAGADGGSTVGSVDKVTDGDPSVSAEGESGSEPEGGDDFDESDLGDASDDASAMAPGVSSESTVVGSFTYLGMTFAVEPGGESVALVAVDYAKLPEGFVQKQILVVPDAATPDGVDYYSVTRIAANAFSSLTKDNANPDHTGCIELFSDEELLAEAGLAPDDVKDFVISSEDEKSALPVQNGETVTDSRGDAPAIASSPVEPTTEESPDNAIRTIVSMDGNVATLDDGSTYIFTNPLAGCTGILACGIPASVTSIEDDAFAGADTLQYVVVSEGNPEYASFDGALYSADTTNLRLIPEGRVGAVRVASSATSADPEVFSHCPSVDALVADAESEALLLLGSEATQSICVMPASNEGFTTRYTLAKGVESVLESVSISPKNDVFISDVVSHRNRSASAVTVAKLNANGGKLYYWNHTAASGRDVTTYESTSVVHWFISEDGRTLEGYDSSRTRLIDTVTVYDRGDNCVFKGWWHSPNSQGEIDLHGWVPVSEKPELYAIWMCRHDQDANGGIWLDGLSSTPVRKDAPFAWGGATLKLPDGEKYLYRKGYTFVGWNTDKVATEGLPDTTVFPTSPTTYYAIWKANSYTVKYWNRRGNTLLETDTEFTYGEKRSLAPMPSVDFSSGWTATGWALKPSQTEKTYDFGAEVQDLADGSDSDDIVNLYLAAAPHSYTVEYLSWSGSRLLGSDSEFVYDVDRELATIPEGSDRSGWEPVGWALNPGERTGKFASNEWVKNLTDEDGGTVYLYLAMAPKKEYTADLYGNGGLMVYSFGGGGTVNWLHHADNIATWRISDDARTVWGLDADGRTIDTITVADRGEECVLKGWWPDPNSNGQVHFGGDISAAEGPLYAIWMCQHSQDVNGGEWAGAMKGTSPIRKDVTTFAWSGAIAGFPPSEYLYREGYAFVGWNTDKEATEGLVKGYRYPSSPTTYYAIWKANKHKVSWDYNGADDKTNSTDNDIAFGTRIEMKDPGVRKGWAFTGWKRTGGDTGAESYGYPGRVENLPLFCSMPDGDVTFTAQWTPVIEATVPVKATVTVDLLGLEEQKAAQGYVESKCGAALSVKEVRFTPLLGANDLFGDDACAVQLEALVGEAVSPCYAFAMDAVGAESDSAKLSALDMAAYETRIPIRYRLAIPGDVLASIDTGRFDQINTSVCSVTYIVGLTPAMNEGQIAKNP